jgi:Scramblase
LALEEDHQVGKISKQWPGLLKEMFTKADNFGVTCTYYYYHTSLYVHRVQTKNVCNMYEFLAVTFSCQVLTTMQALS